MPQHEGWFFWFLRRLNTILLTIIALAIVVLGGHQLWRSVWLKHELFGGPVVAALPASSGNVKSTDFVVQTEAYPTPDTQYGPQTNVIYVQRHAEPLPANSSPETAELYPQGDAVNVMVIDENTGEGHWLFHGTGRYIMTRDVVYQGAPVASSEYGVDPRPIIGMVMLVVDSDTNKNGALDEKDIISVYLWRKGGTEAVKLLTSDTIPGIGQIGADRYLVTYEKGKKSMAALYSVPDFKLISDKPLPDAPH
jgi:hypothetical protein